MRIIFSCLLLCASWMTYAQSDVPGIVVIQKKIKVDDPKKDPNVLVGSIMARELDEEGRVAPIVWALSDPVFRRALEQQVFINPPLEPDIDFATDAANKLKAPYVLYVQAYWQDEKIQASCELFQGKRSIWKESSAYIVTGTGNDWENAARTLARTWAIKMSAEPFKSLPTRKKQNTPDGERSNNANITIDVPPPITREVDNREVSDKSLKMIAEGKVADAVSFLRDAIDAEPLDFERRRLLFTALMQMKEFVLAAEESRRAASLFPEKVEAWVFSARAWLAADRTQDANSDINEAVARDPDNAIVRLLMGEVALRSERFSSSIEHFTKSIEKAPNSENHFRRALARAIMGNVSGADEDLAEFSRLYNKPNLIDDIDRIKFVNLCVDRALTVTIGDIRTLIQRVRRNAKEQTLGTDLALYANRITAMSHVLAQTPLPKVHQNSSELRILALKLLTQTLGDIKGSMGTLNEDALTDATLNLSEAIKSLDRAKEVFGDERSISS